jgi:hypothetical protein
VAGRMRAPMTTSEWPFIYFVRECNTISAPRRRGEE